MVDVDECDRRRSGRRVCPFGEPFLEDRTVGKTRQRVVQGQIAHPFQRLVARERRADDV